MQQSKKASDRVRHITEKNSAASFLKKDEEKVKFTRVWEFQNQHTIIDLLVAVVVENVEKVGLRRGNISSFTRMSEVGALKKRVYNFCNFCSLQI